LVARLPWVSPFEVIGSIDRIARQPCRDVDREDPEPGHFVTIDRVCRQIALTALDFVNQFA
jgi:hypothetical protein